jgi:hypothetical protein
VVVRKLEAANGNLGKWGAFSHDRATRLSTVPTFSAKPETQCQLSQRNDIRRFDTMEKYKDFLATSVLHDHKPVRASDVDLELCN